MAVVVEGRKDVESEVYLLCRSTWIPKRRARGRKEIALATHKVKILNTAPRKSGKQKKRRKEKHFMASRLEKEFGFQDIKKGP